MMEFINAESAPASIVSDRGSEFTGNLFRAVCDVLNVKYHYTTSYHSMCNGMTEKANSSIKKILLHLCRNDILTWDKQLPFATLAMNTAFQSSIEEIPFFLHRGRDATVPFNKLINDDSRVRYTEDDYSVEMSARMTRAFKQVKEMSQKAHENSAKYYNRKVRNENNQIRVGSLVLLKKRNEKAGKLECLAYPIRGTLQGIGPI